MTRRQERTESAVAFAFGACALVVAYVSIGYLQAKLFRAPDPRLVLTTTRVAWFWTLVLAAYVASMAVLAAFFARRRFGAARVDRLLPALVVVATLVGVARAVWP